jgi:siroheme synthase-like protein
LQVGADVTVVSPELSSKLTSLVSQGSVRHIARRYQAGDLNGQSLAFVATDDAEVNGAVFLQGKERGVWVNAADDPAHCDFILPSVLRRGELVVAVATGGSSPALSRAIREELEAYFTGDYAMLAEIVGEVRRELKKYSLHPSADAWRQALDSDLRQLIREGNQRAAKACLLERLGAGICR